MTIQPRDVLKTFSPRLKARPAPVRPALLAAKIAAMRVAIAEVQNHRELHAECISILGDSLAETRLIQVSYQDPSILDQLHPANE